MRARDLLPAPGTPDGVALAAAGLDGAEALLQASPGELVKAALPGREVRRFESGGRAWFLKRVRGRGWREVAHELRVLQRLRQQDLPVAHPVAFAARRKEAVLVSAALPARVTLEHRLLVEGVGCDELRRLTGRVAELLRRLHGCGVCHRDFYLGHLLLDEGGTPYLVDLGRAEIRRRVPRRRVVKDLAALDFSTPQGLVPDRLRLRFLDRYLGTARQPPLRRLAADVRARSRRMRRHAERRLARGAPNIHVNPA